MKAGSLERALEAERGRKGFSTEQRDALWKGIDRAIGLAVAAPKPEAPPAPPPAPPAPPAPLAPSAVPAASLKVAALVAVAALGGIGVGALAHAQWAEPRTVVVDRPVPASVATVTAPPPVTAVPLTAPTEAATATVVPNRAVPPALATPASASPVAAKDPALARERTLLDMARTALSRGDASSALTTLDTHAREFPKSQLSEEREVLAVQALASANRLPEARVRASAFKARYPKSALTAVVDEAIQ